LLENTPDDLALFGVLGRLEIDPTRAFIFLPRLGGIYEMTSKQSGILEDLLSQRLVSSGIPETSKSYTLRAIFVRHGECMVSEQRFPG
jgi:hypothetical protein